MASDVGTVGSGDVGFGAAGGFTTGFGTVEVGRGAVVVGAVGTGTGAVGTGTEVVGRVGAGTGKVGVVSVTVGRGMAGDWRLEPPSGTSASAVPTQRQRARVTVRTAADFIMNSTDQGPHSVAALGQGWRKTPLSGGPHLGASSAQAQRRARDDCATTAE